MAKDKPQQQQQAGQKPKRGLSENSLNQGNTNQGRGKTTAVPTVKQGEVQQDDTTMTGGPSGMRTGE